VAGFGGLRRPLLAVAALLVGIAWSFGYITLAVGHLNILSVAFGVILIGLGIDFGIHYLARYLQLREGNANTNEALIDTAGTVGPGIVTGGLTTALAFSTAALTEFTGVAELGVVAGGGILLCIAAALLMLPALLAVSDGRENAPIPQSTLPFAALCRPTTSMPRVVICLTLAATAWLAYGITKLRYDHNLLNLQPRNQESVEVERKLAATSERSVWFAVSMCQDREQLQARKAALEASPVITATEEIVSLLPESSGQTQLTIQGIHERLASLPEQPPLLPVMPQAELLQRLAELSAQGPVPDSPTSQGGAMGDLMQQLSRLAPQHYFERVSRLQQSNAEAVLASLRAIHAMSRPAPPTIDDLPGPLVHRYVGRRGQHLLRIYGHSDIWNMNSLRAFVGAVEAVDPLATGHPIQTFYASGQMQQSYIHAAVYSLLAVAIVLVLDFRNLTHTLLAMLPMGLGFAQLLGLLGWLGIPLNPANMIVLPLILGIGIDDGVHVVHDFLRQETDYQMSSSTATGVFLTSATTMIGFGSMMIASHAGLRSLGQVLTLGVFCCLVSSVLVLPAILGRIRRD
jgi:hopanoid biosynthesis associated RND transporter like protein HpnN